MKDTVLLDSELNVGGGAGAHSSAAGGGGSEPSAASYLGPQYAAGAGTVGPSGDQNTDALISGSVWNATSLTFNFPVSPVHYGFDYSDELEQQNGFAPAAYHIQVATRNVLANQFPRYTGLSFSEVGPTVRADISLAMSNDPPTAWAYGPDPAMVGGDVWFANNGTYDHPVRGNYAWHTVMHELGHSLGLIHGHQGGGVTPDPMTSDRDSMEFSVMTYRAYVGDPGNGYPNEEFGYAQSLMMYDIAALQHMYGANFSSNAGNTVYTWSPTTGQMFLNSVGETAPGANRIFLTVWDGGGIDTYDLSNYSANLSIDLAPGGWSTFSTSQLAQLHYDGNHTARANVFNALLYQGDVRSLIENAVGGTGSDTIAGNIADNALSGGGGGDTLRGLDGIDTLDGGAGDDRLYGGIGNDVLTGGSGIDRLYGEDGDDILNVEASDVTYDGGIGNDVLNVVTSANTNLSIGSAAIETANGNSGRDTISAAGATPAVAIFGRDGDDTLTGGSGGDTIWGEEGNDTLVGGNGADTLLGGGGNDMVWLEATDALVDGNEGYDYAFVATGADTTINLVAQGFEAATGNTGADVLNGAGAAFAVALNGGAGADQLIGGDANDQFIFDAADTAVIGGAGIDFAWAFGETAAVTVDIGASGLEIVWGGMGGDTLNGSSATAALQIVGDGGDDVITGGSGGSIMVGGYGADQIMGGAAGDQLFFDSFDTVVNGGGGFDFAFAHNSAAVTIDLAAQALESVHGSNLDDLLDASGMVGTALLLGNAGADQLIGGAGNDQLWFDLSDTVVQGGAGIDTAYAYNVGTSAVTMMLAPRGLESVWGGFGGDALDATGVTVGVTLVGLAGNDTLTGGSGNDVLSLGTGDDIVTGGDGSDQIFGEGGRDVAVYAGSSAAYTVTNYGNGLVTVSGGGFVDSLYNVEVLRFASGDVVL